MTLELIKIGIKMLPKPELADNFVYQLSSWKELPTAGGKYDTEKSETKRYSCPKNEKVDNAALTLNDAMFTLLFVF